ncbi:cell wall-active antibiotics response protein [Nocardioides sp. W3-2-3]|nr:cell wall-active antibiotics response protein [Nocardioides convexus]
MDPTESAALDGRTVGIDLNVGHIRVIVPDDGLRVDVDASIEAGEVVLFGEKTDRSTKKPYGDTTDPHLTIDADMYLGQIEVMTEKEAA